jgi:hypothetical protein
VSERDAFEDEMLFASLSDRDAERLLRGLAPEDDELAEVAEFVRAARLQVVASPAPDPALVARLAATAGSAARVGATSPTAAVGPRRRRGLPSRPRLALAARAVSLIAAIPLLFAGLAIADVTLPEPARKAFEAVGVKLPNQPPENAQQAAPRDRAAPQSSDRGGPAATAPEESAPKTDPGEAATEKRGQGTTRSNPAREGGRAEGEQGQGRALGKRGLAPGQIQPPGQTRAPGQAKQPAGRTKAQPPPSKQPPSPPAQSAEPAHPPKAPTPPQGTGPNS